MMASCTVLLLTLGWLLRSSIRGEAHTLSLSFYPFNLLSICVHTLSFLLLFLQLPLLSLSLISSSCSQTHSQYLSLPFILSSSLSYLPPLSLPLSLSPVELFPLVLFIVPTSIITTMYTVCALFKFQS